MSLRNEFIAMSAIKEKNMKSNLKAKKENEIILSIGMIVKNEEMHLDNCLSALQKLRDNVSNELIIVDTGSTDRTKEIALKYTDKVYDFEWINDFSAARNFGLEKAKGKWFMFLDADEYIDEDCSEMISFFNLSELYEKYNSAFYIVRNYDNKVTKDANDFLALRLVKLEPGVKFHGAIHESLPGKFPQGCFGTVFHHYGYLANDTEYLKKKRERNYPMALKEYEENPSDGRAIGQLIDSIDDKNEKLKYINKSLELIDLPQNIYYVNNILITAIRFFALNHMEKKALELCDVFIKREGNENTVVLLSVYLTMATVYIEQFEYELAAEALEKYIELYDDYKTGKLDLSDLRFCIIDGCNEYRYQQYTLMYINCLCKLKKIDKAYEQIKKINIDNMDVAELRSYMTNYRELFKEIKDYSQASNLYKKVLTYNDIDKTGLVLYMFEQYYMGHQFERTEFINGMIDSGVEGPYIELMKLVRDSNDGIDISERLSDFIHSVNSWKDGYSEAIYLAMKHNVDLNDAIAGMSHDILKSHFPIIAEGHSDYALTAMKYCENIDFTGSIKSMLWMVSALETAVLTSQKLLADERRELYDLFLCTLSDYVLNIYNPELLNPEDADVLPELHRFGYYMTLAFTAKNNNDDIAYIRTLKEALRLCEPMKDLVSFYLSEFEEELRSKN